MCTKKTPLYERHVEAGAKMAEFAGFSMPIQYPTGTIEEHNYVRTRAGLFDVSHMGEIILRGPGTGLFLDYLLTNVMSNLKSGRIRYGVMCKEDGGALDDLIVYRLAEEEFLAVVNASNKDKDRNWIKKQSEVWNENPDHADLHVAAEDVSDQFGLIALQGPLSRTLLEEAMAEAKEDLPTKYYSFKDHLKLMDHEVLISRTGYTGEWGYEIYCKPEALADLWQGLLDLGGKDRLIPCGLGARDTLRLEAGMCLYGHELSEDIKPTEADIDFAIKLDRPAFIGQDALREKPTHIRIGLEGLGRGIMREGYKVYQNDTLIGQVTSGTMSPYTKKSIAMARCRILEDYDGLWVDNRGRRLDVKKVSMPFYDKQ